MCSSLRFVSRTLLVTAFAVTASTTQASVVFTDFSSGFNFATDRGQQTRGGVTFSYRDTGDIDLRPSAGHLDISNGRAGGTGTVVLSFANVPGGYSLEMDVGGFESPFRNDERLGNFNVSPDVVSIAPNGPTWDGTWLRTVVGTNLMQLADRATFRFDTAPSTLIFTYESPDTFTSFRIGELRLAPTAPVVPEPSSLCVFVGLMAAGWTTRRWWREVI